MAKAVTLVGGHFSFKRKLDGTLDNRKVVCIHCKEELAYHRSSSSLKYHLKAKHITGSNVTSNLTSLVQQPTLDQCIPRCVNTHTSARLTTSIAKWIAKDCRPVNIVTDQGLKEVIRIATSDPSFELPSRSTIMPRIIELYINEKKCKAELLSQSKSVALTGDHWTSVGQHNYLGTTAHLIDKNWHMHSFALTVLKSEERHFAEACAEQFIQVAKEWEIESKITTVGTDSARNMIAASRLLPFEHMPCIAHLIQRTIVMALREGSFDGILVKCRKLV